MTRFYYLKCSDSGAIFYVGVTHKTLKERLFQHLSDSRVANLPVYNFVREHSVNLIIEVIEEDEFEYEDQIKQREAYWIDQFRQWGFPIQNVLYNMGYKRKNKRQREKTYGRNILMENSLWNKLSELAEKDRRTTKNFIYTTMLKLASENGYQWSEIYLQINKKD